MTDAKTVILISGGGSGGHISAAAALYEYCVSNSISAFLVVSKSDALSGCIKSVAADDLILCNAPAFSFNPYKFIFNRIHLLFSVMRLKRIMKKQKVCCVISAGGYTSVPACRAALALKKPLYLCEMNTVPGKTVNNFAKKAEAVFTAYEETKKNAKPHVASKVRCIGVPVRRKILAEVSKDDARAFFRLTHCDTVILALGGGRGSASINRLILGIKKNFPDSFSRTGIIWSTGTRSFDKYRTIIHEQNDLGSIFISPCIDDMGLAYHAADLVLTRSGALVLAECAAAGVPSVLIPVSSPGDRQNKNADLFSRSGASVKIEMKDASPDKVAPLVGDLLGSSQKLRVMGAKALSLSKNDAAEKIITAVMEKCK